ncbi:unnamed protein product, partial [Allacma fusca]
PIIFGLECR